MPQKRSRGAGPGSTHNSASVSCDGGVVGTWMVRTAPHASRLTVASATVELTVTLTTTSSASYVPDDVVEPRWHPVCCQSRPLMHPVSLPTSTYRLQFNADFTF